MLVPVLSVEMTPVKTRVVSRVVVPSFHDVDFSIFWPFERVLGE